jgi:hypothetical protein
VPKSERHVEQDEAPTAQAPGVNQGHWQTEPKR